MTHFSSATILASLLAATITSFFIMRGLSTPLPPVELGTKTPASTQEQTSAPIQEKALTEEELAAKNVRVDYNILSRQSLFRDTRTEETDDPYADGNAASKADEDEVNRTFELIGIARIGKPDEAAPVAIIEDVSKLNSRVPGRFPMRPGMSPQPRGAQPAQSVSAPTEKASRKIYKVGDIIGTSNYRIKEIVVEEDKVILVRGGKEVALTIDVANTKNSVRRERVKKEEIDKQAQQQATARQQAQIAQQQAQQRTQQQQQQKQQPSPNTPQPPPPPPAPVTAQQNGQQQRNTTNTISAERRQQMEQQRQQILERIRQRQAEQQRR